MPQTLGHGDNSAPTSFHHHMSTLRPNQLVIKAGALPPSLMVRHFKPDEWEEFIERSALQRELNGRKYHQVKCFGGPGDAGRDVEARLTDALTADQWDLYQGKHYKAPLTPGEIFPELAKFFRHLAAGTYPTPRRYFVCSPQNAGPDLHDLIAAPAKLKQRFLTDWAGGKTGMKNLVSYLTPEVRAVIDAFDFARIEECLLRDLLGWHAIDHATHCRIFHIEAERGDDPAMPLLPTEDEQIYVEELVAVYAEQGSSARTVEEIMLTAYADHFTDCRLEFYCAEGLKRFSRDLFEEDEFSKLLDMVLKGVRTAVSSPRNRVGLDRLDAAVNRASSLTLTDSALHGRMRGGDLPGSCHHLVNEKKLRWIK
ncbi:ABC-three component system protein [Paraburkholderia nemoris]|uniref:ABC-three component system protein n=1 Tax=Paraburkholderia nemoris TaxID=2793076 RepID=UPI0038B7B162